MKEHELAVVHFARWIFLAGLSLAATFSMQAKDDGKYFVYIGTYTEHGSKGIYVCEFDAATGRLGAPELAAETVQPSFLTITPDRKFLYAVNESNQFNGQAAGGVSAFAIDSTTGKLKMLNQVSSRGSGPAHIVLDRTNRYALVANYDGGSVAVFHLLPDGKIGESTGFAQHHGAGPNKERQKTPHAHAIAMSPDNRFALVADLGIDEVLVYPFDASRGTLGEARVTKMEAGAGPRHLIFSASGKLLYLINELSSTITVYSYEARDGGLTPVQTVSTLPKGFKGFSTAAEVALHPSGKFLYASNRDDDNSIAVFAVDPAKGTLTLIENAPSLGQRPRNFAIDPGGDWLIVAHQDSDTVVTFRIDKNSGRLSPGGQSLAISSPAMVDFMARGGTR